MIKKILTSIGIVVAILAATEKSQTHSVFPEVGVAGINGISCSSCHSHKGVRKGPGKVVITIANQSGPTYTYKPDSTYTVNVTVIDSTEKRMGFEWASVDSTYNQQGNATLTNTTNTYLQTGNGIQYVSHHNADTIVKSWSFHWQAPSTNVGTITFDCSGNATNNDGSDLGDNVYVSSIALVYKGTAGTHNLSALNKPYLNYYNNTIHVKMPLYNTNDYVLSVYDLTGRMVYSGHINTDSNILLADFSNSMYVAVITSDNTIVSSQKFVKQ